MDKEKIEQQYDEALVWTAENRSQYPGSTYEDGVAAALGWVLGESDEAPIQ